MWMDGFADLARTMRSFPRAVWVLFFGTFLNKFGSFVLPFLSLYLTEQGFTLARAGVAIGAYGLGHLMASAAGGHLADTLGRRRTIVLSMVSVGVTMLLLSQARSFGWIVVLTGLAGFTGELYRPASSALLTDLVPPHQRVTAFASYRLALNAGWAFGPATAGFLAKSSFLWLFIGDAATSLLFGLVAWFALPEGVRAKPEEAGWWDALNVMRQDVEFVRIVLSSLAIAFVFFQMSTTYGLHVTKLGFSEATYGLLISLNGVLIVFFELPLTTLTVRFPAKRMLAVGYVLIGLGFALNAVATTIPALAFAMAVFTIGEMVSMPVGGAFVSNLAPAHMRGRYNGVFSLGWAIALTISPGLGMQLFRFHPAWLWLGCGGLGLLAAWIILREPKSVAKNPR